MTEMKQHAGLRIERQQLSVETRPGHPGQRRLLVSYHLAIDATDPIVGHEIKAHIVIRGIEVGDNPIAVIEDPIAVIEDSYVAVAGNSRHEVDRLVHRVSLDVEQDWWSSGDGGETVPIAEWIDHIVAMVGIEVDAVAVADALTPVVSGSWGALGES